MLLLLWIFGSLWLLLLMLMVYEKHSLHQRRSQVSSYRGLFIQTFSLLTNAQENINKLKELLEFASSEQLQVFEQYLEALEDTVEQLRALPQRGGPADKLRPVLFTAHKLDQKVRELFKHIAIKIHNNSQSVMQNLDIKGCYFCSRPFLPEKFAPTGITISGIPMQVSACHWCHVELKQYGKLDVLYFNYAGEQIHWSKAADYDPKTDFWRLYQDKGLFGKKLKIVYQSDKFKGSKDESV